MTCGPTRIEDDDEGLSRLVRSGVRELAANIYPAHHFAGNCRTTCRWIYTVWCFFIKVPPGGDDETETEESGCVISNPNDIRIRRCLSSIAAAFCSRFCEYNYRLHSSSSLDSNSAPLSLASLFVCHMFENKHFSVFCLTLLGRLSDTNYINLRMAQHNTEKLHLDLKVEPAVYVEKV